MSEQPKSTTPAAFAPAALLGDEWEWHQSLHAPRDAAARRAHFEQTERFNAFHDGLDSPKIRAAIDRAREKALGAIKARKSPNDKLTDAGTKTP